MAISASFNQPFNEQLAAFRLRLDKLVPTQRWDDLNQAQHARAFAVAGAQKAQLLADLAASVDTAIAQGKSLDWFAKNFDALVARNGWSPKGGNDWRARVIYDTNISTSYAAGRLSQLQAGDYPLWIYKHSHLAREPRPHHLALDGIVKPPGDPFWQSRYPPRGFGCKCRVVGVRDTKTARNLGGQPDKPLPEWIDQINPKTGLPPGVDKGWGMGLGALDNTALIQHLLRQAKKLPEPLRSSVQRDLLAQGRPRGAAPVLGAADPTTSLPLLSEVERAKLDGDARAWVVGQGKQEGHEYLLVYDAATGKEIARHTDQRRDRLVIPEALRILLDSRKNALVLHHNHPDSVSLSLPDLSLLQRAGVHEVVAHGHNGAQFSARAGQHSGWAKLAFPAARREMHHQIDIAIKKRLPVAGLEAHLFNLALHRAGIIQYRYQLDPRLGKLYDQEQAAYAAIVDSVTASILRVLP